MRRILALFARDVTPSHLYNYGFADFAGFPNTHDAGLVILDKPITQTNQASLVTSYGSLASVGSLDRLATRRGQQDVTFTASGYGLSRSNPVKTVSFRKSGAAATTSCTGSTRQPCKPGSARRSARRSGASSASRISR